MSVSLLFLVWFFAIGLTTGTSLSKAGPVLSRPLRSIKTDKNTGNSNTDVNMDKDKDKDKDDKRVLQGSTTPGSPSVSQSSELRVRLPEFSITVGPSSRTLSNYQARRVRDVAETEVENYIRTVYELSAETVYDYASLLGVGSVEWSNTDSSARSSCCFPGWIDCGPIDR